MSNNELFVTFSRYQLAVSKMQRIVVTGGSGALGKSLSSIIKNPVLSIDIRRCEHFSEQQVVDFGAVGELASLLKPDDVMVHIAALHGIHEIRKLATPEQFWGTNVDSTFNLIEAARKKGIQKVVFLSSESVNKPSSFYGLTKRINETMFDFYSDAHGMSIVSLRCRAFSPYDDPIYEKSPTPMVDWVKYFMRGSVHIKDVANCVIKAIEHPNDGKHHKLTIDGAYEYTADDLRNWTPVTYKKYYSNYEDVIRKFGLDMSQPPKIKGSEEASRLLGYKPTFSLRSALELLRYQQ